MTTRTGAVHSGFMTAVGSLVVVAGLFWLLMRAPEDGRSKLQSGGNSDGTQSAGLATDESGDGRSLLMYCAAGIKPPIESAAKAFEEEFGIQIQLQYGGSGTLLSTLQVARQGDLYLAADTSYTNIAREKGLLAETVPVAKMVPVIAVRKGNPKNIHSVEDLLRDDVRVAFANPDAASIGKQARKILENAGHWKQLNDRITVFKPTVTEIATDVILGAVDAAVVWDATANQHPDKLEAVQEVLFDAAAKTVTIGVLKSTRHPSLALKFARFLQAPEKGQQAFQKFAYQTIAGDDWIEHPELLLYSGGVNRLAIQDTIREFEAREDVRVNVVYNGCGILVGMIKGNQHRQPDAYFACDVSFMTQVTDRFLESRNLSQTDMVLIVQKDNPKKIASVLDLTRDGLRIGIANEEQSALGALTHRLFEQIPAEGGHLYDAIQKNISVRTPTADLLVNQLRVGGLDAAIVYAANVGAVREHLEVIPISEGDPTAIQPIAISKATKYPFLTRRLVDALTSEKSQQRFTSVGFGWRGELGAR